MKTIFLGDTHGRTLWKDIINKESPNRVVFIGDYFDATEISSENQLNNFLDIVEYKKNNSESTTLLIGNHDFHYMFNYERYSGFQPKMYSQFNHLLKLHEKLFQVVVLIDNLLCSHAGISSEWLRIHSIKENGDIVSDINELFTTRPMAFSFNGTEPTGENTYQTPIWIRPNSLMKANKKSFLKKNYIQIVGHTKVSEKIEMKSYKKFTGDKYFLIDFIGSGRYLSYDGKELTIQSI